MCVAACAVSSRLPWRLEPSALEAGTVPLYFPTLLVAAVVALLLLLQSTWPSMPGALGWFLHRQALPPLPSVLRLPPLPQWLGQRDHPPRRPLPAPHPRPLCQALQRLQVVARAWAVPPTSAVPASSLPSALNGTVAGGIAKLGLSTLTQDTDGMLSALQVMHPR